MIFVQQHSLGLPDMLNRKDFLGRYLSRNNVIHLPVFKVSNIDFVLTQRGMLLHAGLLLNREPALVVLQVLYLGHL